MSAKVVGIVTVVLVPVNVVLPACLLRNSAENPGYVNNENNNKIAGIMR
tara:strand:+ start:925 stop:1071 length:147 start_codon:yes stop_codon:yes gene_type:complete